MNLTTYDPWRTLAQLQQEVSRALEGGTDGSTSATADWSPLVDIREEADRYVLLADVPGVVPEDIEVTAENGTLTLRGERRLSGETDQRNFKRVERRHGSFYRRFLLPDAVDTDHISARSQHGVLEVVIPKQPQVQPRRVPVAN